MNVEIVVLKCQKYNECFNVQCSTLSAIVIVIAKNRHIYIYMCVVVAMLPCLVEGQLKKSFTTVFSSSLWNTHHGPQTGLLTEEE